jgi:tetraacyldisaccharide 4'-kinase
MKLISIGNLSLGGTNKTPLTIKLGQYFQSKGYNITIISRGYKGKLGSKNHIITDGISYFHYPQFAADEPFLIGQNLSCPVITGKKREISLKIAHSKFNPDVVLLDDAFQCRKVKRDLDILILNHTNPISTGLPFPFGMIREFPYSIKRADIILFTNYNNKYIPEKIKKYINKSYYFINTLPLYLSNGENIYPLNILKNQSIYAFCGIAKPERFFKIIEKFHPSSIYKRKFIDHKTYNSNLINKILVESTKLKVEYVITTEKDFVKTRNYKVNNMLYLKIDITIDNELDFFKSVDRKLGYSLSCSNENSATLNQKPSLFIKSNSV